MNKFLKSLLDILNNIFKPSPPSPPSPSTEQIAIELLTACNYERSRANIPELIIDDRLNLAAGKHAQWMSDNMLLSHTGSRGSNHAVRIMNEGYVPQSTGENIAGGYTTVMSVMQGWMNSRGHRANILSNRFINCGFAKVEKYWCAVFASPKNHSIENQENQELESSIGLYYHGDIDMHESGRLRR